jgi:membrane-associated PAP2 superfamily phosphatase
MKFEDAPGVKSLLDHSLHQIGMMMLTIATVCELAVMSGHVKTQYAVVRALSYSFICSLGLGAVIQNVLPLLNAKWANGMKFFQFSINLGMFLLNWKVASGQEKPSDEGGYPTPTKKRD